MSASAAAFDQLEVKSKPSCSAFDEYESLILAMTILVAGSNCSLLRVSRLIVGQYALHIFMPIAARDSSPWYALPTTWLGLTIFSA